MNFLDDGQQRDLLQRLIRLTRQKKLKWETGAGNQYFFRTTIGDRFVYAITSRDSDDYAPFDFLIYDQRRPEPAPAIERVGTEEFGDDNDDLRTLYYAAKRNAMDLESLATEIFSELDELEG